MHWSERRRRRSNHPIRAVGFQLDAVAHEAGAAALFVADRDGLLIGASDGPFDGETLAAYAPLPWQLDRSADDLVVAVLDDLPHAAGYRLALRRFEAGGATLTLGALVRDPLDSRRREALDRAIAGLVRILGPSP